MKNQLIGSASAMAEEIERLRTEKAKLLEAAKLIHSMAVFGTCRATGEIKTHPIQMPTLDNRAWYILQSSIVFAEGGGE